MLSFFIWGVYGGLSFTGQDLHNHTYYFYSAITTWYEAEIVSEYKVVDI